LVGARWLLLTALVPVLGWYARGFRGVRALPAAARLPVYFATGLVTLCAEMFALSAIGVRWSFALLLPVPLLLGITTLMRTSIDAEATPRPRWITILAVAALAIFLSAALSGAITSGDYVLFWGVKGQRFGAERILDAAFMIEPNHYMHPDYPPLVPLSYAWTMLGGGLAMDWWGGVAAAPLFLTLSVMALWGFGRYARIEATDAIAAVFASLFALLYLLNSVGGNAEPALLFFATVACCALACQHDRELDPIAAIALTGAALSKVEGGVFALLVLGISWIARRGAWRHRAIAGTLVAILPCAALAAWLAFAHAHHLSDTYVPKGDLSLAYLRPAAMTMARELSLHLAYTPWIACAILLLLAPRKRAGVVWLLIAAAFIAFLIAIAMRPDPHMEWNAGRTLMTPLLLCIVASLAASRRGEPAGPYNRPLS
jgi:hypothetical protein